MAAPVRRGRTLDAPVVNRGRLSGGESQARSRDTLAWITSADNYIRLPVSVPCTSLPLKALKTKTFSEFSRPDYQMNVDDGIKLPRHYCIKLISFL